MEIQHFPLGLFSLVVVLCLLGYHMIKRQQKYHVRSFSEIIDSVLSAGWGRQLMVLGGVTLSAFILSWALIDLIPDLRWANENNVRPHTFWMTICYFFDAGNLNLTNHDTPDWQWAISLIVAVMGMTILTGLFISTFTNIIQQRVDDVEKGFVTYKKIHNHSVVIGFSDLTESVIRGILGKNAQDNRKIILLTGCDMNHVRRSMYNLMHADEYEGSVVLYSGDYRYDENLKRLNLDVAEDIYILGDDGIDSRDFENIACAQRVSAILSKLQNLRNPKPMYVRLDRMPSFSTLQRLDINNEFFSENIYFRPFNYYEHWARLLWVKHEVDIYDITGQKMHLDYPSLCFDENVKSDKFVHLVVSGFSQMGMALVLHGLRAAHFGNYTEDNNLRTRITVVDPEMKSLRPVFESQYQHIEQIYDVDLDFRDCMLEDMSAEIAEWSRDKHRLMTIAICFSDADAALSQALNMPLDVYFQSGRKSFDLPNILVRQKSLSGIWNMLEERRHEELDDKLYDAKPFRMAPYNKYHNVHPFGMLVSNFYPDDLDDLKPCLVHADYEDTWLFPDKDDSQKATLVHLYELVMKRDDAKLMELIDLVRYRWLLQSENVKWANRYQTDSHHILLDYLRSMGISHIEDVKLEDEFVNVLCSDMEHRRWVGERVVSGWQQSPITKDEKPLRQDALLLHYDITKTSEIGSELAKDSSVVRNVLILDEIYNYVKQICN